MKTRMPISTISYNSRPFLLNKLQELERNHRIDAWAFIYHYSEADEKSDHFHVLMIPNGTLDTTVLRDEFNEFVPTNPLPLKVIPFHLSKKIDDWILYNAHYRPYLTWKHQKRKYHYDFDCFASSDSMWLEYLINHALTASEFAERSATLKAIQDSRNNLGSLIDTGVVPLNMATSVYAYRNLIDGDLDRNGRITHTPKDGDKGLDVTKDGIIGGGGVILDTYDVPYPGSEDILDDSNLFSENMPFDFDSDYFEGWDNNDSC